MTATELPDSWLHPQGEGIPILRTSPLTTTFWDGVEAGELRYQRCRACGSALFNPAHVCRSCTSSALEWQLSAGLGTVYSYTVCYRPMTPDFTTPYAPILVDLDEGYQMLSDLVGCDVSDIQVGMRVKVLFHRIGARSLPYFEPA